MVDRRVVELAAAALRDTCGLPGPAAVPGAGVVAAPSATVVAALGAAGVAVRAADLAQLPDEGCAAVALLDDELSAAGDGGEALVAEAARAVRPGGLLVVSVLGAVYAAATRADLAGARGYTAEELRRALGHRGCAVEQLWAPGAAAALAGDPRGPLQVELDRSPGLLDAAARVVAVARRGRDAAERSAAFFSTLPRKVVAAAVLCRDDAGRVLVVYDTFKQAWTLPGGVVDADEDPRSGAVREAEEEAGVRVAAGSVLGVFASSWPDRIVFVYAARPLSDPAAAAPRHAHEIAAVEWVHLDEALARLAPHVAEQVRACLTDPGGTLVQRGPA